MHTNYSRLLESTGERNSHHYAELHQHIEHNNTNTTTSSGLLYRESANNTTPALKVSNEKGKVADSKMQEIGVVSQESGSTNAMRDASQDTKEAPPDYTKLTSTTTDAEELPTYSSIMFDPPQATSGNNCQLVTLT